MKTIQERLREADPLQREAGLSTADRERIRRAMLTTPPGRPVSRWSDSLMVAAALAVAMLVVIDQRSDSIPAPSGGDGRTDARPAAPERERRQLHFSTPGGTRVIWVFDSSFDLR